jgi:hypothetical protein
VAVIVAPLQGPDFPDPPRREEKEPDDVGEVGVQVRAERVDVLAREEALAHATRVAFRFRNIRFGAELLGPDRECEAL